MNIATLYKENPWLPSLNLTEESVKLFPVISILANNRQNVADSKQILDNLGIFVNLLDENGKVSYDALRMFAYSKEEFEKKLGALGNGLAFTLFMENPSVILNDKFKMMVDYLEANNLPTKRNNGKLVKELKSYYNFKDKYGDLRENTVEQITSEPIVSLPENENLFQEVNPVDYTDDAFIESIYGASAVEQTEVPVMDLDKGIVLTDLGYVGEDISADDPIRLVLSGNETALDDNSLEVYEELLEKTKEVLMTLRGDDLVNDTVASNLRKMILNGAFSKEEIIYNSLVYGDIIDQNKLTELREIITSVASRGAR